MNATTSKIFDLRKDMSDYVFHFTKGAIAQKTFQTIINEKKIKDISKKGFICFTEAPLPSLVDLFDFFNSYREPMYSPYGFGIRKELFFSMGGRPVIYGNDEDLERLKSIGFEWRTLRYAPSDYDFSWLREWRIPVTELELNYDNCIAVVPTEKEVEDLTMELDDITVDAEPEDGGSTTFYYGKMKRIFRSVSLNHIRKIEKMGREELNDLLDKCSEIEDVYLGCHWE